jgi:predicted Holliday junction resolvase-like endonuclease
LPSTSGEVEIVFIEVKMGQSGLPPRERAVKKAVEAKGFFGAYSNRDVEVSRRGFNPCSPAV